MPCNHHNWVPDPDQCSICGYKRRRPGLLMDKAAIVHYQAWPLNMHLSVCAWGKLADNTGQFARTRRIVVT